MKKASSSKASPVQNLPLSVVLVLQEYRTFCACSLLARACIASRRVKLTRPFSVEVAVHTLLYTRHIYPSDAFIPRTKWGVTVQMMRFPMVIDYVGAALEASMAQIAHGALVGRAILLSHLRRANLDCGRILGGKSAYNPCPPSLARLPRGTLAL